MDAKIESDDAHQTYYAEVRKLLVQIYQSIDVKVADSGPNCAEPHGFNTIKNRVNEVFKAEEIKVSAWDCPDQVKNDCGDNTARNLVYQAITGKIPVGKDDNSPHRPKNLRWQTINWIESAKGEEPTSLEDYKKDNSGSNSSSGSSNTSNNMVANLSLEKILGTFLGVIIGTLYFEGLIFVIAGFIHATQPLVWLLAMSGIHFSAALTPLQLLLYTAMASTSIITGAMAIILTTVVLGTLWVSKIDDMISGLAKLGSRDGFDFDPRNSINFSSVLTNGIGKEPLKLTGSSDNSKNSSNNNSNDDANGENNNNENANGDNNNNNNQ